MSFTRISLVAIALISANISAWAAPVQPPGFAVAYYPYEQRVRARMEFFDEQSAAAIEKATFELKREGVADPLVTTNVPLRPVPEIRSLPNNPLAREAIFDTPDLEGGKYKVTATIAGHKRPLTATFERKVWEWEHNDIGRSRRVIAPFTPLQIFGEEDVDHRPKVHSILRTHTMNSFGLWDQVIAKEEPILASPICLEARVAGKAVEFKNGPIAVVESSPDRVQLKANIQSDPVQANVISTFDYDGMMKVELELAATQKTIESLVLRVPVRKDIAEFLHVSGDSIRENFAAAVPNGDGIVWVSKGANGTGHGYGGIWGTFMPYVWLGGPERGICWFADSDEDWSLNDELSALDIVRENETVTLRVHLFNKPTKLDKARRIVFGLQATPVKPMPAPTNGHTWRSWSFCGPYPNAMNIAVLGQGQLWGAAEAYTEIYPRRRDFSIFEEFERARKARNAYIGWVDESGWLKGYFDQSRAEEYRGDVTSGMTAASMADQLIVYTNARGAEDSNSEEALNYNPRPVAGNVWDEPAPSMQDFSLFYSQKMMERGVDGIYLDNTYAHGNFDTISSDAYVREDGKLQPSMGIWRMREYIKRIAHMYDEAGKTPYTMAHMTNANVVPSLSFATIALDWEHHYGASDFQDRFPLDYILSQSIGRQIGLVPVGLGGVREITDPEEFRRVTRTQFGVAMVHEIKLWGWLDSEEVGRLYKLIYDFGYGMEDCRVFTYWDGDQPISIDGANAKALVLDRGNRAMVVIANFGNVASANLTIDTSELGLPDNVSATDAETGETVALTGKALAVDLPRHDLRILVLE